jgi:hypothetical protein
MNLPEEIREETLKVVIVRSSSKKLIKGCVYECDSYKVKENGYKCISIKGIGTYSNLDLFKTLDGKSLKEIKPFKTKKSNVINFTYNLEKDKLKEGDIIVCRYSTSKYLSKGNNYIVKEIKHGQNYRGETVIDKVKVNNGKNLFYSISNFSLIDKTEQRKLKFSNMDGGEITSRKRKFENFTENEKCTVILNILSGIFKNIDFVYELKNFNLLDEILLIGKNNDMIESDVKKIIDVDFYQKLIEKNLK